MCLITFIDVEVDPSRKKICDIGGVKDNGSRFHKASTPEFIEFIRGTEFLCGHNIIHHDLEYLGNAIQIAGLDPANAIDTLYLSPLLFPKRPYHALSKDDKQNIEDSNNPFNDSISCMHLFNEEVSRFNGTDGELQQIYCALLKDTREFKAFFRYLRFSEGEESLEKLIQKRFKDSICEHVDFLKISSESPTELAYCLALIACNDRYSIAPAWVLRNFPEVEGVMAILRNKACPTGCGYCDQALDIHKALKEYFNFPEFRSFGGEPLQEQAVQAAVDHKSLLAVFPTGGGKSMAFQIPALMAGRNEKGLTVVISPLQSLMKDQVDNLEDKGIKDAVTINGLLDPITRANAIGRVREGNASILYISPESLRSKTIEKMLLDRNVVRFVIDEAHCLSSWGQDFRVDYLYIGSFINALQEKKGREGPIAVSCFTATAKQQVIEDICTYFEDKLGLILEKFPSRESRANLHYRVFERQDERTKYEKVRNLIDEKDCPTIIYVSRTKKASELVTQLKRDGYTASMYHGKLESRQKTANQNAFIKGEVQVMVATSAFGMGVDKKDVGMVIHYEISDSLENYVQESGRAGRDMDIQAHCYVLFNEDDLGKHFSLLNNSKLTLNEIKQIWCGIKYLTKYRPSVQKSALEIARSAGWDDTQKQIETRVKTAISALEEAGYLKRKQNMPRVFANSIQTRTADQAINMIQASSIFGPKQQIQAERIIKSLFSSKSAKGLDRDEAEARVDYLADNLGISVKEAMGVIGLLKEAGVLADAMDLQAFIKKGADKNRSMSLLKEYGHIELFLAQKFEQEERIFNIKELNGMAEASGLKNVSIKKIRTLINYWASRNWIDRKFNGHSNNHLAVASRLDPGELLIHIEKRHNLAKFIVGHLLAMSKNLDESENMEKGEILVEFSVLGLLEAYGTQSRMFEEKTTIGDIEDTLFYLSKIEAIKIEGGFLVIYNKLMIERLDANNRIQYKEHDYKKLQKFYEHKIEQIHIVGEYAKKMIEDPAEALKFVEDYFQLDFPSFLNKYFGQGRAHELKRNMTPKKYRQLIGELSDAQSKIIRDKDSKNIVVTAGPGSGKTKILAHKLASLILLEDVKHEQLLMLTFSRAAVTEFKKRLKGLIGPASHYVEIMTFHSYCFDLLGKIGTLEESGNIIKKVVEKIKQDDIERNRITKLVLVIDEAQDINGDELELISILMEKNEDMRVLAVGDDDQNIFEWRGADSRFLMGMIQEHGATKYEMTTNFRSKANLVAFGDQFVQGIGNRLKRTPLKAFQMGMGKIMIHKYGHGNLISPLIEDICASELTGTTCVLTPNNAQAALVSGVLNRQGRHARLIQDKEGFRLKDLMEVRFFLKQLDRTKGIVIVDKEEWESAKNTVKHEFGATPKYEIIERLIKDFEETHPKRYISDFQVFLEESKFGDFQKGKGDSIIVSTIHKAKGKEFDNVFLLLEDFDARKDNQKRQLYVALTRAKENLTVHTNGNHFDHIKAEGLERIENNNLYPEPKELILNLDHTDLHLGYFEYVQDRMNGLVPGSVLQVSKEGCEINGKSVLKFSMKFKIKLEEHEEKGFELKAAYVNFMVYWTDKNNNKEVLIILPELYLEKDVVEGPPHQIKKIVL